LRRRDTCIDPGVLDEVGPGGCTFVLAHCGTGDADVVVVEKGGVEWLGWVDRDYLGFVDGAPNKFYSCC
jgi:hypothetical protein